MKISNEAIATGGKAAFYACIYEYLRQVAINCGWALGLHGSLNKDMDIMAMPWTEDARPVEEMIQALSDCFTDNVWKDHHVIPHYNKPNKRVVYTMSIWKDFYLDINIIQPEIDPEKSEYEKAKKEQAKSAVEFVFKKIDSLEKEYFQVYKQNEELKMEIAKLKVTAK